MKYNDYPENLPEVLVEKLNKEYLKSKKLQVEFEPDTTAPAPVPAPAIPSPEIDNLVVSLQNLTASEINSLVINIINGLGQLDCYLKEYACKSPNASLRQSLNNIANSVAQTKNSFVESFNLRGTTCPPPCFSQSTNRRRLRDKIIDLFYCVLKNMITLFANYPAEFGLVMTLSNTLDNFYNFLTLPQVNQ